MEAYKDDYIRYEKYKGKLIAMSPRPSPRHMDICYNMYDIFKDYLKGKSCTPYGDGYNVYVFGDESTYYEPDFFILCDKTKVRGNGIWGAPDFVAEVLSPKSVYRDRTEKFESYAVAGVKEYWIISPMGNSIEQYVLDNGKYSLQAVRYLYTADEIAMFDDEEDKQVLSTVLSTIIFPELIVDLHDVFKDRWEN